MSRNLGLSMILLVDPLMALPGIPKFQMNSWTKLCSVEMEVRMLGRCACACGCVWSDQSLDLAHSKPAPHCHWTGHAGVRYLLTTVPDLQTSGTALAQGWLGPGGYLAPRSVCRRPGKIICDFYPKWVKMINFSKNSGSKLSQNGGYKKLHFREKKVFHTNSKKIG